MNILGMEERDGVPGRGGVQQDGREWRLDTVLEEPGDQELFIMFADGTSGHETYGGRTLPVHPAARRAARAQVDFNKAVQPAVRAQRLRDLPAAAPQNRLKLRVTAGENVEPGHA